MNKHSGNEKGLEGLVEALIKMLGKSNEQVNDLNKRVGQLEMLIREAVIRDYTLMEQHSKRKMKIS